MPDDEPLSYPGVPHIDQRRRPRPPGSVGTNRAAPAAPRTNTASSTHFCTRSPGTTCDASATSRSSGTARGTDPSVPHVVAVIGIRGAKTMSYDSVNPRRSVGPSTTTAASRPSSAP